MTTKTKTPKTPKAKTEKKVETIEVTTAPLRKVAPRVATIVKGSRVDKHYNNDGSITLYVSSVKIFRTAGDNEIENGEVSDEYDAEEAADKFLRKWFGRKEFTIGRVTHGHKWKKKVKAAPADDSEKKEG